jgi:glycosyltransferase involved in cell wall biosynthesis
MKTTIIIPALNEEGAIGELVAETRAVGAGGVIVVDNGSQDATAARAAAAGARVVSEPRRGYGWACACGAAAATEAGAALLVFMDGDHSFLPAELPRLLTPLQRDQADLVLGSRTLGQVAPGAMPPQQRFGNWLGAWLMRRLYRLPITDLGPFRAVRAELLRALEMREMTYGWPTEMTVKAARRRARLLEVPVSFLPRRAGDSKVSGTVRGTLLAGYRILDLTFRYAWGRDG